MLINNKGRGTRPPARMSLRLGEDGERGNGITLASCLRGLFSFLVFSVPRSACREPLFLPRPDVLQDGFSTVTRVPRLKDFGLLTFDLRLCPKGQQ